MLIVLIVYASTPSTTTIYQQYDKQSNHKIAPTSNSFTKFASSNSLSLSLVFGVQNRDRCFCLVGLLMWRWVTKHYKLLLCPQMNIEICLTFRLSRPMWSEQMAHTIRWHYANDQRIHKLAFGVYVLTRTKRLRKFHARRQCRLLLIHIWRRQETISAYQSAYDVCFSMVTMLNICESKYVILQWLWIAYIYIKRDGVRTKMCHRSWNNRFLLLKYISLSIITVTINY